MKSTDKFIHVDSIHTAFCAKRDSDFNFVGESHNFWELVYVIDGSVGIMAGSSIYTLHKNNIIFHKPYEFHRIWSAENTTPSYMIISFNLSGRGAFRLSDMTFEVNEDEVYFLNNLIKYISNNKPDKDHFLDFSGDTEPEYSCFVYTLDLLLANCLKHSVSDSKDKSETALIFESVVKYMESNLDSNPSNTAFAEYANISNSTLKRIFFKYSSLGVHTYFMTLKMMKAKNLLRNGMSVCNVSKQLGFSNQNNFSATFKRIVGVSPSEYN